MIKLTARSTEVLTGGPMIAIINQLDAEMHGLNHTDRVLLRNAHKPEKQMRALVDIAVSDDAVPPGHVALNVELMNLLDLRPRQSVLLFVDQRPVSVSYIRKKLDGHSLSEEELRTIVRDTVSNALSDVELTYFIAANYFRGLSMRETIALTKAMVDEGETLELDVYPVVDKHCIGGVAGNRTTMVVVPILAAAGLFIPKTSTRSITSPAGTADTMEVLTNVS
ncbi:thymidine phosphorylase, partial [Candidatus Woesearchaeota archaeon]